MSNITILPAIDLLNGKCVRLRQGDYSQETVYSDTPAEQAKQWESDGAEILHLVDLDGAKEGKPVNIPAIKAITEAISIPCELGGGIRTIEDAKNVFDAGISRIILGTIACREPEIVDAMIAEFGADKIVIGIDAKDGKAAVSGWLEDSGIDAFELAAKFAKKGVKRFIYTDISTDGMLSGPNIEAQTKLCDTLPNCSIIASGGVSCANDIKLLAETERKNLEGVIVGKALYDGKTTLKELLKVANTK